MVLTEYAELEQKGLFPSNPNKIWVDLSKKIPWSMENLRASALRLVAYPVKHGERTPKKPCFDIIAGITGKWN